MILENDETSLFRHSWSLYDALAEMNYMHHREIYACVAELLAEIHQRGPWTLLDLGCGNARFLAPCLMSTTPQHYIGINLSPPRWRKQALASWRTCHLVRCIAKTC